MTRSPCAEHDTGLELQCASLRRGQQSARGPVPLLVSFPAGKKLTDRALWQAHKRGATKRVMRRGDREGGSAVVGLLGPVRSRAGVDQGQGNYVRRARD